MRPERATAKRACNQRGGSEDVSNSKRCRFNPAIPGAANPARNWLPYVRTLILITIFSIFSPLFRRLENRRVAGFGGVDGGLLISELANIKFPTVFLRDGNEIS